eukprot:gene4530-4856_t
MAMRKLPLASVETCIKAAYTRFVNRTQGNFNVTTANWNVLIDVGLNNGLWNCGFPGYYMAEKDIDGLRRWCKENPGNGTAFGFLGLEPNHPHTINITFRSNPTFNFHVNTGN